MDGRNGGLTGTLGLGQVPLEFLLVITDVAHTHWFLEVIIR